MTESTALPLACLHDVQVHYGSVAALQGVSFSLHRGEVLALLGRNGAGKSTAISLLLGLRRADAGRVELLGGDPQDLDRRGGIGVMLQATALPAVLQVRELVDLARTCYVDPRSLDDCLALAGLTDLARRRYGRLSGGQQRRVQFAIAVCGRPQLLFPG